MIAPTITRNGDRLYVGPQGRLAFLAKRAYDNAWGWSCVEGTLFDLQDGGAQRNAVAWCNLPDSEARIVEATLREHE